MSQANLVSLINAQVAAVEGSAEHIAGVKAGVALTFDALQQNDYIVMGAPVEEVRPVVVGAATESLFSSQLFAEISTEAPAAE